MVFHQVINYSAFARPYGTRYSYYSQRIIILEGENRRIGNAAHLL